VDLGDRIIPTDVNARGQVAGYFLEFNNTPDHVRFITGANGVGKTLLDVTSDVSFFGINNTGQVVGSERWGADCCSSRAFFTGADGAGRTYLEPLGGLGITASDINDSGQVVGSTDTPPGFSFHAFITGANGLGMKDLGTLGGYYSNAIAVNASGQVAGLSFTNYSEPHAFITGPNGAGMTDLTPGIGYSEATAINDTGQVAGNFSASDGHTHAFVTGADGAEWRDLGALHGANSSVAYGINASGWVVGHSYMINDGMSGSFSAFIAGINGAGMMDLNSYVSLENKNLFFSDAFAINNVGQIVAQATDGHAYLLSPIPEPQTYAMLLVGLGLVGFIARRRKQAS
jgi:probable HAF family extracellular repeat protein